MNHGFRFALRDRQACDRCAEERRRAMLMSTRCQRPLLAQPPLLRNFLEFLVARGGFEPPTFGL